MLYYSHYAGIMMLYHLFFMLPFTFISIFIAKYYPDHCDKVYHELNLNVRDYVYGMSILGFIFTLVLLIILAFIFRNKTRISIDDAYSQESYKDLGCCGILFLYKIGVMFLTFVFYLIWNIMGITIIASNSGCFSRNPYYMAFALVVLIIMIIDLGVKCHMMFAWYKYVKYYCAKPVDPDNV